jgi:GT2 family glycosyltransferase
LEKKVAIILLNWNSYEHTANCIESLSAVRPANFDILVVDNGSTDGSGTALQNKFNHIIYLPNATNEGFAGGNNRGFAYAIEHDYAYSLMLNNDVFVEPNFLDLLVNYLEANPAVGAIQPKIFFNSNRQKVWNGGSYFLSWLGWTYSKNYMRAAGPTQSKFAQVDWITGCALLVRTSIVKQIGALNDHFFIYYEDVDFSFRIRAAGYKLMFHPDSVIYHIAGMANKAKVKGKEGYANPYVHYLNFRNHIWVLRAYTKWYQWPTTFITLIAYSLAIMLYFVARWRWTKLAMMLKGILHGFTKQSSA